MGVRISLHTSLPLWKKIIKKKEVNIIKGITKKEAFALREKGLSYYVKRSYSKHPKYYVVENKSVLKTLDDYRKSIGIK